MYYPEVDGNVIIIQNFDIPLKYRELELRYVDISKI